MFNKILAILLHNEKFNFLREIIKNPRSMGAVLPSSKTLAKQIAKAVPIKSSGLILELGAGTGVITQALLNHGIKPENIIAIERSQTFANYLQKKFPKITVIHGDAMDAAFLLQDRRQEVYAVVSGLPLRSLPTLLVEAIIEQLHIILKPSDLLIQFTYNPTHHPIAQLSTKIQLKNRKRVWWNIPPAVVEVYEAK